MEAMDVLVFVNAGQLIWGLCNVNFLREWNKWYCGEADKGTKKIKTWVE